MASYDAVVNLNVVGTRRLERVNAAIGQLNDLTRQLNSNLNLLAPGAGKLGDNLRKAFEPIKNFARQAENGTAKLSNTLAGASSQAQVFATVLDNVKVKAGGLGAQEGTVKNLSAAWLETTLNAQRYQKVLEELKASQLAAKGLMQLGSGEIVPGTEAGFGEQGPRLPAVFGKRRTRGGLDLPEGVSRLAPKRLQGLQAAFAKPGMADAVIGGGFPLLFGGGPGSVLGGAAGGLAGGMLGGPLGMALSIGASAIGQQLDKAFAESIRLVDELGKAIENLSVDTLRDSVIAVNADLDVTVDRLLRAGEADEARAEIGRQVALQTGLLPEATQKTSRAVDALSTAWNEVVGAVSGLLSLISTDLINGVAILLQGVAKVVQLFNLGLQAIRKWSPALRLIDEVQKLVVGRLPAINEGHEEIRAELIKETDEYQRQLELSLKLGRATELEKVRIEGNAKIEEKIAQARLKYRGQDTTLLEKQIRAQGELKIKEEEKRVLQKEQLDLNKRIKDQLSEMKTKYDEITTAAQKRIDKEQAAIDRGLSVANARYNAEKASLDLDQLRLERAYDYAKTEKARYKIAIALYKNAVATAEIEYKQQLESIAAAERKLEVKVRELQLAEQETILLAKRARIAAQEEEKKDPVAREKRLAAINKYTDDYLSTSQQTIAEVKKQLETQRQIGEYQRETARAQLQAKIETAGMKLEQKLVSEEIGLSEEAARYLVGSLQNASTEAVNIRTGTEQVVGVIETATNRTVILAGAMSNVAAQAHNAAVNIGNAIEAQARLDAMRSGGGGGSTTAYASGGYVTGPTRGLVGEAGPEYVIPAGKMDEAMSRYASGQRGSSVIPSSINPQVSVTTGPVMNMNGSNYVSQNDFLAGMQTASRRGAEMALQALQSSTNVRRAVGIG